MHHQLLCYICEAFTTGMTKHYGNVLVNNEPKLPDNLTKVPKNVILDSTHVTLSHLVQLLNK